MGRAYTFLEGLRDRPKETIGKWTGYKFDVMSRDSGCFIGFGSKVQATGNGWSLRGISVYIHTLSLGSVRIRHRCFLPILFYRFYFWVSVGGGIIYLVIGFSIS